MSGQDVAMLRLVVLRELETINQYEEMARDAEEEHLRSFFRHLADEEKEHVSEAMALLAERDEAQDRWNRSVNIQAGHFAGEKSENAKESPVTGGSATEPALPAESSTDGGAMAAPSSNSSPALKSKILGPVPARYTVGSLRGS